MRAASALAVLVLAAGAAAHDSFAVTGRFLYLDKSWDWNGWTGAREEKPVRFADVRVLDAQSHKVLGRGFTGADGEFSVSCKAGAAQEIIVRLEASNRFRHAAGHVSPSLSVIDDLARCWSVSSPEAWASGAADLDVGTTTALPVLADGSDGNPFNLYDLAVAAWEHVHEADGAAPHGSMRLQWPSWTGSWALGRTAHVADDDGYDDAVILHELGHVVHGVWSDSDSPGGMHWFGDSDQDPRLSFAEGWATCFAGLVLAGLGQPAQYLDCAGEAAVGGADLRLDLESLAPYTASAMGSTDEVAVACSLFDVLDDAGALDDDAFANGLQIDGLSAGQAWWKVFTGPVRHAPRLSLDGVWDGWAKVFGEAGRFDELHPIFDARGLRFWNDAFEPDNTPDQATPLVVGAGWSPEHTLYYAGTWPAEAGSGDQDWFSVWLQAGQVVRIETRYPGGAPDACTQADTHLTILDPYARPFATDEDGGIGRNARVDALVAYVSGPWQFRVDTRSQTGRYGRYEVRVVAIPSN